MSTHVCTTHKRARKAEAHHPANPACGRGFQRAHPPPCKGCERGSREGLTLLAPHVGTFYGTSNRKKPRGRTERTKQLHENWWQEGHTHADQEEHTQGQESHLEEMASDNGVLHISHTQSIWERRYMSLVQMYTHSCPCTGERREACSPASLGCGRVIKISTVLHSRHEREKANLSSACSPVDTSACMYRCVCGCSGSGKAWWLPYTQCNEKMQLCTFTCIPLGMLTFSGYYLLLYSFYFSFYSQCQSSIHSWQSIKYVSHITNLFSQISMKSWSFPLF